MIHIPDTNLLPAFEAEIAKAKKRLDSVYSDVESLKNNKSILESDIVRLDKHISYLNDTIATLKTEADKKAQTIKGIDNEIETRQVQLEGLRKEEGDINKYLSEKQDEIRLIDEKLKEHSERMLREAASSEENIRSASQKHAHADEKLAKITSFIASLK